MFQIDTCNRIHANLSFKIIHSELLSLASVVYSAIPVLIWEMKHNKPLYSMRL